MFDRIAGRYDVLNSLMTAGLHHRWRERAAERAGLGTGDSALDVCCGTGDLALELADRVAPDGHVVGCDFSEPMLDLARDKAAERGADGSVSSGPTRSQLPYDDARFDAVTVGFGVRNFADRDRGLREMARVLRPGGRLVVLEITQPHRPPFSTFYSLWFDRIVPLLGRLTRRPRGLHVPARVGPRLPRRRAASRRRCEDAGLGGSAGRSSPGGSSRFTAASRE